MPGSQAFQTSIANADFWFSFFCTREKPKSQEELLESSYDDKEKGNGKHQ